MSKPTKTETIRRWMRANASRFVDPRTGETNTTLMVETWDLEEGTGDETLDPSHTAWDVASEWT